MSAEQMGLFGGSATEPKPVTLTNESTSRNEPSTPLSRAREYVDTYPLVTSGVYDPNAAFRLASTLLTTYGLQVSQAFDLVLRWNLHCHPRLPASDLIGLVMQASKRGRR